MVKKRVFVLDCLDAYSLLKDFSTISYPGQFEVDGSTSQVEHKRHLPENYDVYLIHLSHTELEAIEELKENQPWCKVYVRTMIGVGLPADYNSQINGMYKIEKLGDFVRDKLVVEGRK